MSYPPKIRGSIKNKMVQHLYRSTSVSFQSKGDNVLLFVWNSTLKFLTSKFRKCCRVLCSTNNAPHDMIRPKINVHVRIQTHFSSRFSSSLGRLVGTLTPPPYVPFYTLPALTTGVQQNRAASNGRHQGVAVEGGCRRGLPGVGREGG